MTPYSYISFNVKIHTHTHNNSNNNNIMVCNIFVFTHLNVHHILKHIVLSQKNAAKKTKCITMAETKI